MQGSGFSDDPKPLKPTQTPSPAGRGSALSFLAECAGVPLVLSFGVWGRGGGGRFRVWGLGFRVWGLGLRVWGLGFRVWGLGFRV